MKKFLNILSIVLVAAISALVLYSTGIPVYISASVPLVAAGLALYLGLKGNLTSLFYNLVFITLFAGVLVSVFGPSSLMIAGIFYMLALIPVNSPLKRFGALHSEVLRVMFSKDLQAKLYPDNAFYKDAQKDENIAIDCTVIEIPQEGAAPGVVKNPEVRPLPLEVPVDLKKTYGADLYETKPSLITNLNQALLSYDKRAAKLRTHINELETRIAEEIAISWYPQNYISTRTLVSTGATGGVTKTGFSGARKKVTFADFQRLKYLVGRYIKDDGRFRILVDAELIPEIQAISEFKDYDKSGVTGVPQTGAIGKILNMNVFVREGALYTDNSKVVKPYGSALGANDRMAILAWHPDFVRYAEGLNEVYMDSEVRPGMGGRTFNAAVRGGGTFNRIDELGIAALIQDIV